MDEIKVHIWELPLKEDNINKLVDYAIVHDGTLKKVKMEKVYEYFNQDYKIQNTVTYFDNLIKSINEEYEPKYMSLQEFLNEYGIIVDNFIDKFKTNRDDIRIIETKVNGFFNVLNGINISFININKSNDALVVIFKDIRNDLNDIQTSIDSNTIHLTNLNSNATNISNIFSQSFSNSENMKEQITSIKSNLNQNVEDKKETLIKNIENEYDKVLAILDYYHHITTHDD